MPTFPSGGVALDGAVSLMHVAARTVTVRDVSSIIRSTARRRDVSAAALVSLLAHDLRTPLGPIALAVSSIEEDPEAGDDARELAAMAGAQIERAGRLIDATVLAARGLVDVARERVDVRTAARHAVTRYEALGGVGSVEGESWWCDGDADLLRAGILDLIEVVAGESGSVEIRCVRDGGGARVALHGSDPDGARASLAATEPHNARAALALGGAEIVRAHGGSIAHADGGIVLLFGGAA